MSLNAEVDRKYRPAWVHDEFKTPQQGIRHPNILFDR